MGQRGKVFGSLNARRSLLWGGGERDLVHELKAGRSSMELAW